MALTVQKQPEGSVLSGNPVEYIISSDTVVQSNHKIHIRVTRDLGIGFGNVVIGTEELPVIENSVTFDISDYLKSEQKIDLNIFQLFEKKIQQTQLSSKYYFRIWETYNNDGIEHNAINGNTYYAFNGGFSTIFLSNYNAEGKTFYFNFIIDEKKILSWSPNKKLTWNQHEVMFFYGIINGNGFPRYTLYFSDDTSQVVDMPQSLVKINEYHFVNTSYLANEFSNYETPSKLITHYDIIILSATFVEVTETRTYYLDRNYYNQGRQFIFKNSLAGYDIIHLKGLSENTDEIQRTVGFFQTKNDISFTEFTETFEAASGFLVNSYKSVEDAQRYIIELFNSHEIYEIVGKEIIPVIQNDKKVLIKRDREFLYSFEFEYEYAYSDRFFAPFDTEQYLDPRIFYSNGIVTPEPAEPGLLATLDFDVIINEDATIDFEINWGADVGITNLNGEVLLDGVTKPLQTTIVIPGNVDGPRQIIITDSKGGRYIIDYTVGNLEMLFETGEGTLFEDDEQILFES